MCHTVSGLFLWHWQCSVFFLAAPPHQPISPLYCVSWNSHNNYRGLDFSWSCLWGFLCLTASFPGSCAWNLSWSTWHWSQPKPRFFFNTSIRDTTDWYWQISGNLFIPFYWFLKFLCEFCPSFYLSLPEIRHCHQGWNVQCFPTGQTLFCTPASETYICQFWSFSLQFTASSGNKINTTLLVMLCIECVYVVINHNEQVCECQISLCVFFQAIKHELYLPFILPLVIVYENWFSNDFPGSFWSLGIWIFWTFAVYLLIYSFFFVYYLFSCPMVTAK